MATLAFDTDAIDSLEELIDYSTDYIQTFTWSPRPSVLIQWGNGKFENYHDQFRCMILHCADFDRCCNKYVIVPEVADDGRLHLHGWFNVTDKIKYFKKLLPTLRTYGFIDVRKMRSPKWITYYKKTLMISRELLNKYPCIVYTPLTKKVLFEYIRGRVHKEWTKNGMCRSLDVSDMFSCLFDK